MITVERDLMATALDKLYQAVDKKSGIEELKTIQIKTDPEFLTLGARNRTASAQATLEAQSQQGVYFGIPGGYFKDIVSKMEKGGTLNITIVGPHAVISDGRASFRLKHHMDIPPLEDFESLEYIACNPDLVVKTLKRAYFPETNADINSSINGVHINKKDVVSTNRWMLNIIKNEILDLDEPIRINEDSVKRMINVFAGLGEEGWYYANPNSFVLRASGFSFRTLLLPDSYPNYAKLIPKKAPSLCSMDKGELVSALRRVLILSSNSYVDVSVSPETVKLRCASEHGDSTDELPCECNTTRDLRVNGKFLLDAISRLKEDSVVLEIRRPKADGTDEMIVLTEEGFTSGIAQIQKN